MLGWHSGAPLPLPFLLPGRFRSEASRVQMVWSDGSGQILERFTFAVSLSRVIWLSLNFGLIEVTVVWVGNHVSMLNNYQLATTINKYCIYHPHSSSYFSFLAYFPSHPCNLTKFFIVEVPSFSLISFCATSKAVYPQKRKIAFKTIFCSAVWRQG